MLDYPQFAWRPVDKQSLADDIAPRHQPAGMRIVTVVAIVAKDEVLALGNLCGWHRIVRRRHDIGLIQGHAVDKHLFIGDFHGLTGQADNAFDERVLGCKRWVKDYYVSSLRPGGTVSYLADHNTVTLIEVGFHAGHFHRVALYGESEESKDCHGDKNSYGDLTKNLHGQGFILSQTVKLVHSLGLYLFAVSLNANITSCLGPLAQLVEQLTLNQPVQGSSPWRLTRK